MKRAVPVVPDPRSQLAAIVEHSSDAIFSRTFEGTITTWNAAAGRIFGYPAGEILGRSSRLLLPPGADDEYRRLVARLRRGRVVEHFETERLRRDGQRIRVSLTLSPIFDPARRVTGFSTIARDITGQCRLRDALERREAELDDLFEHASVGLVLVSPSGVVLRANQAFAALLELRPDAVVDRTVRSFHPEPGIPTTLLGRLARRETVINFPTEFHTARGDARFVLVDADGHWEKGRLVHTRWFVRDISRRRQLERELLDASDRERRVFAHELHDGLGQQLGGIAYLSNVLRQNLVDRAAPEVADATRIFNLIRGAIEATRRMSRGLSPIGESPEGLMDALAELAAQTSELRGIRCRLKCRVRVRVPDAVVAGHLYRIAQEAVNNAVKHARPQEIVLSLRAARNRFTLGIADDGRGIRRLSPNRRGLGLHIMHHRAALIRGRLEVRPRHPRGTEVLCRLPSPVAPAVRPRT